MEVFYRICVGILIFLMVTSAIVFINFFLAFKWYAIPSIERLFVKIGKVTGKANIFYEGMSVWKLIKDKWWNIKWGVMKRKLTKQDIQKQSNPPKNSNLTVEPIRDLKALMTIGKDLENQPRNHLLFTLGYQ